MIVIGADVHKSTTRHLARRYHRLLLRADSLPARPATIPGSAASLFDMNAAGKLIAEG